MVKKPKRATRKPTWTIVGRGLIRNKRTGRVYRLGARA